MNLIDSIIKKIGNNATLHIPVSNWGKIKITFVVVSRFSQLGYYYLDSLEGTWTYFPIDEYSGENAPINLFTHLRYLIAKENKSKGTWFSSQMIIEPSGKFNISFDYDNKPHLNYPLEDEDFVEDFQQYPRASQYIPDWLREILVKHRKL